MVSFAAGQVELAASTWVTHKVGNNHIGDTGQILDLIAKFQIPRFSPRTKPDQGAMVLNDPILIKSHTRLADSWPLLISSKAGEPIHHVVGAVSSCKEVTRLKQSQLRRRSNGVKVLHSKTQYSFATLFEGYFVDIAVL